MSVNLGAKIIEKHFTLNKLYDGPDQECSADPADLKYIHDYIKNSKKTIGDGKIDPSKKELQIKKFARKSIFARKKIKKNDIFTKENLELRRPGTGICASKFNKIVGKKSKYNFIIGDQIKV